MTSSLKSTWRLGLALAMGGLAGGAQADFAVFEASGGIAATVDSFRAALGALNPNDGNHHASGRREINWDAVPDSASDPNPFPADFFNSTAPGGRARGALFSTPGSGFLVSADSSPGTTPPSFGFPSDFIPFSPERLFASIGSNITDVTFFVPGTTTPAWVGGFGAVFSDVEVAGASRVELFDPSGASLLTRSVLAAGNGGLSFLGFQAGAGEKIGRVRITAGVDPLLGNGSYTGSTDGVVMDDFLYAEPQPVPIPAAAWLFGPALVALSAFRKRSAS